MLTLDSKNQVERNFTIVDDLLKQKGERQSKMLWVGEKHNFIGAVQ